MNWTTIIPGDASTLPSGDDLVFAKDRDFGVTLRSPKHCRDFPERTIAWLPVPEYTPPASAATKRRDYWLESESGSHFPVCHSTKPPSSYDVEHVRTVLDGDIDPDTALRLRAAAAAVVRNHENGTLERHPRDSRCIYALAAVLKDCTP